MGATKEDMDQINAALAGNVDDIDIDQAIESLQKLKNPEKENPAYQAHETLVWNGRMAAQGSVFLVVKHKANGKIYSNVARIGKGFTPEQKQEICFQLWKSLSEKYKL